MDIAELQVQARRIRETYARETARRYGRSWTPEEYMLGFLGDVGDLAKLDRAAALLRARTGRADLLGDTRHETSALAPVADPVLGCLHGQVTWTSLLGLCV